MESLCLSSASILRCARFSSLQEKLLIIPTALEIVFSTSVVVTNWGSGRRHFLLTAEGWIYFVLALIDMLSHILPAVRDSLPTFKAFDKTLAATSFLPIFFYTVFLYLFTRAEFLIILPKRLQHISKFALIIFIPGIVTVNEIASFVGISYRLTPARPKPLVSIGFANARDELLWTFFTSLTLALLTSYQAINFCFAFCRLIRAFINQRNIEMTSSDQNTLFRGTAWIAGGLKLGAIETVIGFAQDGGFGAALTRRILRLLGRAFIIIGLAKGVDTVVDFTQVRDELSRPTTFRRSSVRPYISNPRISTFHQLSPGATAFHSAPRAPAHLSATTHFMKQADFPRRAQRVTVRLEGGAPTLHMRFSNLDMPSPTTIVESVKSRPQSEWYSSQTPASASIPSRPSTMFQVPTYLTSPQPPVPGRIPHPYANTESLSPMRAIATSPTVTDITYQFPALPPRAAMTLPFPHAGGRVPISNTSSQSVQLKPSNSLTKRKPVPPVSPQLSSTANPVSPTAEPVALITNTIRSEWSRSAVSFSSASSTISTSVLTTTNFSHKTETVTTPGTEHENNADVDPDDEQYPALNSGKSQELMQRNNSTTKRTAEWVGSHAPSGRRGDNYRERTSSWADVPSRRGTVQYQIVQDDGDDTLQERMSKDTLTIPWLKSPAMEEHEARVLKGHRSQTRIKSVGSAPRRSTPTPIRSTYTRGSVYIEPVMASPKYQTGMETLTGTLSSSYGRRVLRDSEVLSIEDNLIHRRSILSN